MSTPRDAERVAAFRQWLDHIGGSISTASEKTGIAARSLQRMRAGRQPPPVRLLERLADELATAGGDDRLADRLAAAAGEGTDA